MRQRKEISQVTIPEGATVHLHIDYVQQINGLPPPSSTFSQFPAADKTKIKWNGTPEEFVEHFAPMIESRKLYMKSKTKGDTAPIARLLYDSFAIYKVGTEEQIAEETLVSYFKKHFADRHL